MGLPANKVLPMITLSDDEVALLRSLLTSLRSIKVRDIDKALVILSKNNLAKDAKTNRGGN
jgi:predicted DNA-binding transcriptional regulator